MTHLFFTDNLFLFGEAGNEQDCVINEVFDTFCRCSGQKVNNSKSHIYISPNTPIESMNAICSVIGFERVDDLGVYLDMPLFHARVGKHSFEFIVDNVRRKLNGWDARRISLAGRITLAKSALL